MKDLTLIIPTKEESESLPIFLKELDTIDCVKLIVLQKEDLETKEAIKEIIKIRAEINEIEMKKIQKINEKILIWMLEHQYILRRLF